MTDAAQFAAEVRRALEDEPYMVTDEVENGFTVHIDVVDAQWWTLMRRKSLSKAFEHIVRVNPDKGTYWVTDRSTSVRWEAGAGVESGIPRPVLTASAGFAQGTLIDVSFRQETGIDDEGNVGRVVDYTFNSSEGNALIDGVAERLGLRKKLNPTAIVGLVVAIIAVAGALLAVIVLLATGLLG